LLEIPRPLLYGGILVFACIGVYSLNNSVFDLALLGIIGVVGYMMRRFDVPIAPAVVGMILGPKAEEQFRRAMGIAQGDASVFFTRPISATILTIAILALVVPAVLKVWNKARTAKTS
jgi:putative tricarboxylic transport membrane protein